MKKLNNYWGEPTFLSSVVVNSHKNRKIPLKELTQEQIRLLLGQDIGTIYLLPLAINILKQNPYTECDFGSCDLLKSMLNRVDIKYYKENKKIYNELKIIMDKFNNDLEKENNERIKDVDEHAVVGAIIDEEEKGYINELWEKIKSELEIN